MSVNICLMDKKGVINFYQSQLKKFKYLQNKGKHITEHGVKITPILIECTVRRLAELRTARDLLTLGILNMENRHNGRT